MNGMQTSIKIMKLVSFEFGYIAWHTALSNYHPTFSLELKSVYLFKVFGWSISIKLTSSIWGWIFFFFWLVCLNDVQAIPLINKVINTTRRSSWTMYKSKEDKSKNNSSGAWVLFVWFKKRKIIFFFLQRMETMRKKLFECQELQLCWHFCSINTPRSILQEPSELANQISLDNLLQRSAAFKRAQSLIIRQSRLHTEWDLELSLPWQGSKLGIFVAQILPPWP